MTRNIFIFLATFVTGAAIALIVRAARFEPNAGHEGHPPKTGAEAPMVSNALAPATNSAAADPHANHNAPVASPAKAKPVNTVCAICGMPVDPSIPTAEYQGQTIGFGCKLCPPKFKAEPDRYGPLYLKNETLKL